MTPSVLSSLSLLASLLLPFIFIYSIYQSAGIMWKFKSMVDMPERLTEFKRVYGIPENVKVRYCPKSEVVFSRGEGRVIIPLVMFVEGGVRIPMSKLLTNFLKHFKVFPDQCTSNVFRVVSSVDELNRRLGLSLTKHDINYVYSFQDSKTLGFYL